MKEISVEWMVKEGIFLPLSYAEIAIYSGEGKSPAIARGRLNSEGKFTATEIDPSNFIVEITSNFESSSSRKSHFSVSERVAEGEEAKEHTAVFKNTYKCQIGKNESNASAITATTNPWSVFQAVADLVETIEQELALYEDYGVIYTYSDKPISHFFQKDIWDKGVLYIRELDHLYWGNIGHEFTHVFNQRFGITKMILGARNYHTVETNQYDFGRDLIATERPGTFENKDLSVSVAFGEAFATWFGVTLFINSKKGQDGDTNYQTVCKVAIPSFQINQFIDPIKGGGYLVRDIEGRGNVYGEDAEWAITQLLWNITNKKDGEFKRIAQDGITNKVNVTLHDLFYEVLLKKTEDKENLNGHHLQNISHFYEKLFNYYVHDNKSNLSDSNLLDVKLEALTKISELGNVFAEFGIAPNIDEITPEENTFIWYQHKTGTLPAHDKFKLYFFERHSGKLLYETGNLVIEPKEIGEYSYGYEYSLSNVASPELEDYDGTSIRVLIRAIGEKQFETGPYLNHLLIDFKPYDNFTPNGGTSFLEPGLALNIGKLKLSNTKISLQGMGDIEYYLTADPWEEGLFVIAVNTSSRPIFVMHGTRPVKGTKTHEDGSEEEVIIEVPSCKEIEMDWGEE